MSAKTLLEEKTPLVIDESQTQVLAWLLLQPRQAITQKIQPENKHSGTEMVRVGSLQQKYVFRWRAAYLFQR